jgi:hypothetical protein
MTEVQEIYTNSIRHLPSGEKLRLAVLILNDLAEMEDSASQRRYALEILEGLPGGQLFKTSVEADAYLREEREAWDR